MNIERNINDEFTQIGSLKGKIGVHYASNTAYNNDIPPDYHVLFVLVRNFKIGNNSYAIAYNSNIEQIFYEAVDNFKESVEYFSNYNVHMICTIKEIDDELIPSNSNYLSYDDLYNNYLKSYNVIGLYDAIIVAYNDSAISGGITTLRSFQPKYALHGYSVAGVTSTDVSKIGHGYSKCRPYLITTEYFIHEWIHQLEGYRLYLNLTSDNNNILFPNPDDFNLSTYSYDSSCFNGYSEMPEPQISAYYRAVLSADVTDTANNNKKIGMYPIFWKLTSRKMFFGKYLVKNTSNGNYLYNNNLNNPSETWGTLQNTENYIWNVYCYPKPDGNLRICQNTSTNQQDWHLEKVDNGKYIYNGATYRIKTENGFYIGYNINNNLICSSTPVTWKFTETNDNYYKISVGSGTNELFWDVYNANDGDDTPINIGVATGYNDAQTWKILLNNSSNTNCNDYVYIIPRLSLKRGFTISSLFSGKLSVYPTKLILERI